MTEQQYEPPRVFISYSHDGPEHRARVLALATRLRGDGVDARLDQFVQHPVEGWPLWMAREVREAHVIVVVCSPSYKIKFEAPETIGGGSGGAWESLLAVQRLYNAKRAEAPILPVLFDDSPETVPDVLQPFTHFRVAEEQGYESLLRVIYESPRTPAPPLGTRPPLPPMTGGSTPPGAG